MSWSLSEKWELACGGLLPVRSVEPLLTARYGDARNGPPCAQPKSLAAARFRFARQVLIEMVGQMAAGLGFFDRTWSPPWIEMVTPRREIDCWISARANLPASMSRRESSKGSSFDCLSFINASISADHDTVLEKRTLVANTK